MSIGGGTRNSKEDPYDVLKGGYKVTPLTLDLKLQLQTQRYHLEL